MKNDSIPVLTIDGPSGSGKGTVCREIAGMLGWHYLDSGAIYRALAVFVLQNNLPENDESVLAQAAETLDVSFGFGKQYSVRIGAKDITDQMATETCGNTASVIAALPKVRGALLNRQRDFRRAPGLVADGRDMGTVVFPDAEYKMYLTASSKIRAQRRYKQLKEKGIDVSLPMITSKLTDRDRRDKGRLNAPLKKADDAIIIDSSNLTVEQVVEQGLALVKRRC